MFVRLEETTNGFHWQNSLRLTLFCNCLESCRSILGLLPGYSTIIFPTVCSVFCREDCVCSHGFSGGKCKGAYCICEGSGPLN